MDKMSVEMNENKKGDIMNLEMKDYLQKINLGNRCDDSSFTEHSHNFSRCLQITHPR